MVLAVCWHATFFWGSEVSLQLGMWCWTRKRTRRNHRWIQFGSSLQLMHLGHDIYILYSKHDLVMAVHCFSILHPKVVCFLVEGIPYGLHMCVFLLGSLREIRSQDIDLCKLWICTHSLWYPPCDYWHSWRYARHLWVFAWPSSISTMRSSAVCSSCQSSRSSSRPCTEMPWLLNHLPSPNSLDAKLWPPLDL